MNTIIKEPLYASIPFGRQIEYSSKVYGKKLFIKKLQAYQKELSAKKNIYLSACITECEIVLNGQIEPHIKVEFINYPKFPLEEPVFKHEIEALTVFLMTELEQNRVVINFHNESKMLEQTSEINSKI